MRSGMRDGSPPHHAEADALPARGRGRPARRGFRGGPRTRHRSPELEPLVDARLAGGAARSAEGTREDAAPRAARLQAPASRVAAAPESQVHLGAVAPRRGRSRAPCDFDDSDGDAYFPDDEGSGAFDGSACGARSSGGGGLCAFDDPEGDAHFPVDVG